ncbi:MAG: Bug family tripartite tricarboxylate transporter substrate binding protein, partial [Betaproteobacteria bacterium]
MKENTKNSTPKRTLLNTRRELLQGSVGLAASALFNGNAFAQGSWPNKGLRVIVPFSAGGAADTSARAISAAIGTIVNQSIVVENRTGGNAMIAAQAALQAPADGYTFLWDAANQLTNPILLKNIPFDYKTSFIPVTLAVRVPQVLA